MTTLTPFACSASLANCETAKLSTASRRWLGPMAPVSPPPWPGSRTTVGVGSGVPAVRAVLFPHGVSTVQPAGPRPSTGRANPWGDMTALAGGSGPVVGGGGGRVVVAGGAVVVGASVVVGNVPAARSNGRRVEVDVDPQAAQTMSATKTRARRGTAPV